jgi:hypothetical protein
MAVGSETEIPEDDYEEDDTCFDCGELPEFCECDDEEEED